MARFNIIAWNNQVGLARDITIISDLIKAADHEVAVSSFRESPKKNVMYDVNIFCEVVNPDWFSVAKTNVLIPNPEYYMLEWLKYLKHFDLVLAKTHEAERLFKERGQFVIYTSFTSVDAYLPDIEKDDNRYFHLAGKSSTKQTLVVEHTWKENPDLPPITILLYHTRRPRQLTAPNIHYVNAFLPDMTVKILENAHGIHVCPSETEGFGHYINEALSAKSIVITTNAPPMNELVTTDRGVLCEYVNKFPLQMATSYQTNEALLELAVREAMQLSSEQKTQMRENARRFYLENDHFFRNTLTSIINDLSL